MSGVYGRMLAIPNRARSGALPTYQGNGLPASATVQDEQATPKETRTTYTYEYDAQGNWIRRIAYNETLKKATLTERKIEYYQ